MGTHTEHDGRKGKKQQKKILPHPFQVPKRKNLDPSQVHAEPFIGCIKLLFPKLFVTIFVVG
jgi:hypothetical protein